MTPFAINNAASVNRLTALRSLITNTRLLPHLTGKRLLGCDLRRMPSYFKPTRSKGNIK